MDKRPSAYAALVCIALLCACTQPEASTAIPVAEASQPQSAQEFKLTSPAFAPETEIPSRFTCDGDDISPALEWTAPPPGTGSLALIMDDPDAPVETWVHWVIFNLPSETRGLPEAVPPGSELPGGGTQGKNSWQTSAYGGPCPPSGAHRYYFDLYALDTVLDLDASATQKQVLAALEGHTLAKAQLMGKYARQ